jgi:hypothetical protein
LKKCVIRKSRRKLAARPLVRLLSGRVEVFEETTEPGFRTRSILA